MRHIVDAPLTRPRHHHPCLALHAGTSLLGTSRRAPSLHRSLAHASPWNQAHHKYEAYTCRHGLWASGTRPVPLPTLLPCSFFSTPCLTGPHCHLRARWCPAPLSTARLVLPFYCLVSMCTAVPLRPAMCHVIDTYLRRRVPWPSAAPWSRLHLVSPSSTHLSVHAMAPTGETVDCVLHCTHARPCAWRQWIPSAPTCRDAPQAPVRHPPTPEPTMGIPRPTNQHFANTRHAERVFVLSCPAADPAPAASQPPPSPRPPRARPPRGPYGASASFRKKGDQKTLQTHASTRTSIKKGAQTRGRRQGAGVRERARRVCSLIPPTTPKQPRRGRVCPSPKRIKEKRGKT